MSKEGAPKKVSEPRKEKIRESMMQEQTIAFLKEKGVELLQGWQPGQPLLYVFEDFLRQERGTFHNIPEHMRPSLARLDAPTLIEFDNPRDGGENRVVYNLRNDAEGQIDFYAIDPATRKPTLVKTSNAGHLYHVRKEGLFAPDDAIFPKSNAKKF